MRSNWFPILLGALFIVLISAPYILAFQNAEEGYKFGGFLLNPIDGNTYLAKMYQGWQGSWRFSLPFTVDQGDGGYMFLFYLALGHLARISGTSNQQMFHLVRIASALALVASLWYFFGRVFVEQRTRRLAFGLALFGSGMGWLASIFGIFSADFWVAEGYPFLSAYANPHFPLGLAIVLWFMAPPPPDLPKHRINLSSQKLILPIIFGLMLAIIMPFGVVIIGVVLGGSLLWDITVSLQASRDNLAFIQLAKVKIQNTEAGQKLFLLILGSAPVLIYQVWLTRSDPILAAWNAQNMTLSPPIWELVIAYSPILLVAIPGCYFAIKSGEQSMRNLLLWAGLGLLLLYVPWSLQRRFISGYMIPLAGLAAITMDRVFSSKKVVGVASLALLIVLMIPTNLMIILGGMQAVENKDENIYLTDDEYQGLMWIESNTSEEAVVLAGPEMGLLIPAYTGRRVWYGHPFETPDAERMESRVLDFFSGTNSNFDKTILQNSDYLYFGTRERKLGELELSSGYERVFESGDTRIYKID